MLQQISGALSKGFSSKQIIDFLLRKYPEHKEKIQGALASGFTIDQILRFLSGGRKSVNEPDNKRGIQTEHRETLEQDIGRRENVNQSALAAGTLAAGAMASPMAASALQRALPSSLTGLANMVGGNQATNQLPVPNVPGQNAQNIQTGAQAPTNLPSNPLTSQPPILGQSIPQNTQTVQPKGIPNPEEYLKEKGVLEKVQAQLKAGNTPEAIAATLGIKDTSGRVKGQIDPELLGAIDEYSKQIPKEIQTEKVTTTVPTEKMQDVIEPEAPKIEKKSTVITPNGVGEVKAIKEKEALIDIDGKTVKVPIEDLESEPKDIADLYDDLFNAIPPEHQSRMMNFAGYDEDSNELLFRPHGGAAYVYKDIPPEFAEELKNRLHRAKTTGTNMYGMWHEGDPSYGAGMSALIKELQAQYGGKGKEYVRKFNTLFDILGVPHEAKKRKEQEERRKRKKHG